MEGGMKVSLWNYGVFPAVMFLLGLLLNSSRATWADDDNGIFQPSKLKMFVDELPEIPRLRGYTVRNGVPAPGSLTVGMFQKEWKFHRDLPPTRVFAYGTSKKTATVPGPTIETLQHVTTHVKWQNHLPRRHILPVDYTIPTASPGSPGVPTVVHLHGAIAEPASDGNAKAWFTAGYKSKGPEWSKKNYTYPNVQEPGNLWYHDHAMGLTRVNLLAGLIGAYVIRNPAVEAPLGLPSGDEFDRNLVVFDRSFWINGSLYMNSTGDNPGIHPKWQPEYFGNVIVVNGKAWPQLKVRRRKYRFRILNASNARFYRFFFTNGLRLVHVSSDSVYLPKPVGLRKFLLAPSEIADVVVDFSNCKSRTAVLANDAPYPFPTGDPTDENNGRVMRFVVEGPPETDKSRVPKKLVEYPKPTLKDVVKTRYIVMYEYESATGDPTHLLLNNKTYDDPVTETPAAGTTELWNVINLTNDNHPLHIHLGLLVAVEQRELVAEEELKACMGRLNDAVKCHLEKHVRGRRVKVRRQEAGWKNVFKMMPGHVTRILVRFKLLEPGMDYPFDVTAEPGYVYHCHILDHEDNVMMRPLKLKY